MRRFLTKRNILILIGVIIIIFLLTRNGSSGRVKNVQVKKVNIESRVVNKTVASSGAVTSENAADLAFPAAQRILKIYVSKDEEVEKAQLLAQLDNSSQLNTVQYYKDARDIALAQRALFERDHEANRETLGGEDQYKLKLREYNETVAQAEAQYRAQAALLKNTYVYAPFKGTILDVLKEEGETAAIGENVFKIADLNTLVFEVNIDQEDYGLLQVDMESEIELDAYPDQIFKAKVSDLPKYAESTENPTFKVQLKFDDANSVKPLLGMTGEVKIITASTKDSVESLYYDEINTDEESQPFVWVIDNGYISKYKIETGLEGDVYTEIKTKPDKDIVVPLTADLDIKDGYKAILVK